MKVIIEVEGDIVTVRTGAYSVTAKEDIPSDDPVEILEYLYDEQVIHELIRDLIQEIL